MYVSDCDDLLSESLKVFAPLANTAHCIALSVFAMSQPKTLALRSSQGWGTAIPNPIGEAGQAPRRNVEVPVYAERLPTLAPDCTPHHLLGSRVNLRPITKGLDEWTPPSLAGVRKPGKLHLRALAFRAASGLFSTLDRCPRLVGLIGRIPLDHLIAVPIRDNDPCRLKETVFSIKYPCGGTRMDGSIVEEAGALQVEQVVAIDVDYASTAYVDDAFGSSVAQVGVAMQEITRTVSLNQMPERVKALVNVVI